MQLTGQKVQLTGQNLHNEHGCDLSCPSIYFLFYDITLNDKLQKLQNRAARVITKCRYMILAPANCFVRGDWVIF